MDLPGDFTSSAGDVRRVTRGVSTYSVPRADGKLIVLLKICAARRLAAAFREPIIRHR